MINVYRTAINGILISHLVYHRCQIHRKVFGCCGNSSCGHWATLIVMTSYYHFWTNIEGKKTSKALSYSVLTYFRSSIDVILSNSCFKPNLANQGQIDSGRSIIASDYAK